MSRYAPAEMLGPQHETSDFDCGSSAQTSWLRKHALKAQQAGTSRVYVVSRVGEDVVVGYHALTAASIGQESAPEAIKAGLPRYPIPATLLARLGVDRSEQGHGLGKALVVDAIRRALAGAEIIGSVALLVHAESEEARAFYEHIAEFQQSPTDALQLMLRFDDLRATLAAD